MYYKKRHVRNCVTVVCGENETQAAQGSTQHLNIGNFIHCVWKYAYYKWNV